MSPVEDFKQFCKERVRSIRDGYPELATEKVTLKEIWKAYNRWVVISNHKKIDIDTLQKLCEENFGDSRDTRVYQHLRVFLDEEDLEDFEKKQHEKELETKDNLYLPTNQTLDEIAHLKAEIKRRDDVINAVKSLNKMRDKELIKIINSLKKLLSCED